MLQRGDLVCDLCVCVCVSLLLMLGHIWTVCARTCSCVCAFSLSSLPVLTQCQIAFACEWIESASKSTTGCSTTKRDCETSVRTIGVPQNLNHMAANTSWSHMVFVRWSYPGGHRGGEGRLWPGDVQALHRQITRCKSFSSSLFTSLRSPLFPPGHHYFMVLVASPTSHVIYRWLSQQHCWDCRAVLWLRVSCRERWHLWKLLM